MKIRTLVVAVLFLAVLSAVVFWTGRPAAPSVSDPRIGQPLADPGVIDRAATLRLTDQGKTVELTRKAGGAWRDVSYYGLAADFAKLSGFVNDLTAAKVQRLVTINPERLERLEFKDSQIELLDASGHALWSIALGRSPATGGRFVRFGHEGKAYLTDLNSPLDPDPKGWADAQLLNLKPEDVARVEVSFDGGAAVACARAKKDGAWTSAGAPAGKKASEDKISSLLTTLGSLRFSDSADPSDPQVAAARQHERIVRLTTFAGKTLTIALGQKPAPKAEKPKGPDEAPAPANPVYAFISSSDSADPINALMKKRAFQVDDYVATGLPQKPDELFGQ